MPQTTPPQPPSPQAAGVPSPARVNDAVFRQISDGDAASLGSLFDQWARPVYSLAMQLLRNHDEAEDVVESTFWQAWKEAGQLQMNAEPGDWLLEVSRHRALDLLRSRRRQREELLLDKRQFGDLVTTSAAEPSSNERRQDFLRALRDLAPDERQALELAYFRGLSQADIADLTGDSVSSIRTRMRSALEKLRQSNAPDVVE